MFGIFLDHINRPNFHLSSLDGNTTPKKSFFQLRNFKQNDSIYFLFCYTNKNIGFFKKNVLNGQFLLFEVVKNYQS